MTCTQSEIELYKFLKEQPTKEIEKNTVDYVCDYLSKNTGLNKEYFLSIIREKGYKIIPNKNRARIFTKSIEDIERHSE